MNKALCISGLMFFAASGCARLSISRGANALGQGRYNDAVELLEDVEDAEARAQLASVHRAQAMAALEAKECDRAAAQFAQAERFSPALLADHRGIYACQSEKSAPPKVMWRTLTRLFEVGENRIPLRLKLMRLQLANGQDAEAISHEEILHRWFALTPADRSHLMQAYIRLGRLESLLTHPRLARTDADRAQIVSALIKLGHHTTVLDNSTLKPSKADLAMISTGLVAQGKYERVLSDPRLSPSKSDHHTMVSALLAKKSYDTLINDQRYQMTGPQRTELVSRLIDAGRFDPFVEHAELPLTDQQRTAMINALLGLEQPDKAFPLLVRAVERRPDDPLLRLKLAELYESRGATDDAQTQYAYLTKAFPKNPVVFLRQAAFLRRLGDKKAALTAELRANELRGIKSQDRRLRRLPKSRR